MSTPHRWAKEIKHWADGGQLQYLRNGIWMDAVEPTFPANDDTQWRIKPAKEYPQTLMTDEQLKEWAVDVRLLRCFAEVVLAHAIDNNQLVIPELVLSSTGGQASFGQFSPVRNYPDLASCQSDPRKYI